MTQSELQQVAFGAPPIDGFSAASPVTAVETCRLFGRPGMGLSHSSSRIALMAAVLLRYIGQEGAALAAVIELARKIEAALAGGVMVGIQDVVCIAIGGAVETWTMASGKVEPRQVCTGDPNWITRHALIVVNPSGRPHRVPEMLPRLIHHRDARAWIEQINPLSLQASGAYRNEDVRELGLAMADYVRVFEEAAAASGGRYMNPAVRKIEGVLAEALGERLVAVKAPGAGDASALAALFLDEAARDEAIQICREAGWEASLVVPTAGLLYEATPVGCRYSAPLRLDFTGLSDVAVNPEIAADGICFGIAIEPRNELVITTSMPWA